MKIKLLVFKTVYVRDLVALPILETGVRCLLLHYVVNSVGLAAVPRHHYVTYKTLDSSDQGPQFTPRASSGLLRELPDAVSDVGVNFE